MVDVVVLSTQVLRLPMVSRAMALVAMVTISWTPLMLGGVQEGGAFKSRSVSIMDTSGTSVHYYCSCFFSTIVND